MRRAILGLLFLTAAAFGGQGRDAAWIQQRLQQIKQANSAAWKTIPWAATLTAAREQSRQENRPVFLFTHDGNLETGRC